MSRMSAVEIRHSIKEMKHKGALNSAEKEGIKTSPQKRLLRWIYIYVTG